MQTKRALYSVVQYVPDSGRAEGANAGVVLYVPSEKRTEIRVSPTLDRIRQFFRPSKQELLLIQMDLESLKHRMERARNEFANEEEFNQFVGARADAMRLSAPRLIKIVDVQSDLHALYNELVGDIEQEKHAQAMPLSQLPDHVAETFGRLESLKKIWRPRPIRIPTLKQDFRVDVAFQNGRVNFVRLESLAPGMRLGSRMMQLGFNGRLIFQHPIDGQASQLVVMSANPQTDPAVEERFEQTLKDFNVRFVPYRQAKEFAAEVEKTAH